MAAAVGGAVGLNAALIWARTQVLEFLREFDLATVWLRIETGGAVGVLILLPLLPTLVMMVGLLFAFAFAVLTFTVRGVAHAHDRMSRVSCAHCDTKVRPEASICPTCHGQLEPTKLLDQPGMLRRGWGAAIAQLRSKKQAWATG